MAALSEPILGQLSLLAWLDFAVLFSQYKTAGGTHKLHECISGAVKRALGHYLGAETTIDTILDAEDGNEPPQPPPSSAAVITDGWAIPVDQTSTSRSTPESTLPETSRYWVGHIRDFLCPSDRSQATALLQFAMRGSGCDELSRYIDAFGELLAVVTTKHDLTAEQEFRSFLGGVVPAELREAVTLNWAVLNNWRAAARFAMTQTATDVEINAPQICQPAVRPASMLEVPPGIERQLSLGPPAPVRAHTSTDIDMRYGVSTALARDDVMLPVLQARQTTPPGQASIIASQAHWGQGQFVPQFGLGQHLPTSSMSIVDDTDGPPGVNVNDDPPAPTQPIRSQSAMPTMSMPSPSTCIIPIDDTPRAVSQASTRGHMVQRVPSPLQPGDWVHWEHVDGQRKPQLGRVGPYRVARRDEQRRCWIVDVGDDKLSLTNKPDGLGPTEIARHGLELEKYIGKRITPQRIAEERAKTYYRPRYLHELIDWTEVDGEVFIRGRYEGESIAHWVNAVPLRELMVVRRFKDENPRFSQAMAARMERRAVEVEAERHAAKASKAERERRKREARAPSMPLPAHATFNTGELADVWKADTDDAPHRLTVLRVRVGEAIGDGCYRCRPVGADPMAPEETFHAQTLTKTNPADDPDRAETIDMIGGWRDVGKDLLIEAVTKEGGRRWIDALGLGRVRAFKDFAENNRSFRRRLKARQKRVEEGLGGHDTAKTV